MTQSRPISIHPAEAAADAALARGNMPQAVALLGQALGAVPANAQLWLKLAALHRARDDPDAALVAADSALSADPLDFTALLMRASLLDALGRPGSAEAYSNALARKPEGTLPPPIAGAVARAEAAHARHVASLGASIAASTQAALARADPAERGRVDRFVSNALRRTRHFGQEPTHFAYPGLPAIEFYDRADFPWLEAFEAKTDAIEAELRATLAVDGSTEPYIAYSKGVPLGQWRELNHSDRWLAVHVIRDGLPDARLAALCPTTMDLLGRAPQPNLHGRSPAAMFSALAPRTRIPRIPASPTSAWSSTCRSSCRPAVASALVAK